MSNTLCWNTVTPLLRSILDQLMKCVLFDPFRLVGGTSLSLQLGHRMSIDIDFFTDATYGSIDFGAIDKYLRDAFPYVMNTSTENVAMGTSYFIGDNEKSCIKLDLFYTEEFIQPILEIQHIRMATIEEIIAMKLNVVQRTGRKKDYWDIHEVIDYHSLHKMLDLHEKRYPYDHNEALIRANLIGCSSADDDFDPICLRGKHWEVIKLDIITLVRKNPFS